MPDVIVNASPLIFLGNSGYLELLRPLGERILVPTAVFREVSSSAHCDRAAEAVRNANWLQPVSVPSIPQTVAAWDLGPGESEVIALGLVNRRSRLVMDDLLGRKCAVGLALEVIGTLGVVVAGYRRKDIEDPAVVLAELRDAGMWLSDKLIASVLELSGCK